MAGRTPLRARKRGFGVRFSTGTKAVRGGSSVFSTRVNRTNAKAFSHENSRENPRAFLLKSLGATAVSGVTSRVRPETADLRKFNQNVMKVSDTENLDKFRCSEYFLNVCCRRMGSSRKGSGGF